MSWLDNTSDVPVSASEYPSSINWSQQLTLTTEVLVGEVITRSELNRSKNLQILSKLLKTMKANRFNSSDQQSSIVIYESGNNTPFS